MDIACDCTGPCDHDLQPDSPAVGAALDILRVRVAVDDTAQHLLEIGNAIHGLRALNIQPLSVFVEHRKLLEQLECACGALLASVGARPSPGMGNGAPR